MKVHVETRPPGASVLLAGKAAGTTPVDLELPRGEQPVTLQLRRDGYAPAEYRVRPDADQRLVMPLVKVRRPGARPAADKPAATQPAPGKRITRFE